MGWNPSPGDPRHRWGAFEFCIFTTQSGMTDGPEIDLIWKRATDANWSPVGASDGMVYCMGPVSWGADVEDAGGFSAWWAKVMAEINVRLAVVCSALDPSAPALSISSTMDLPPLTFASFQAWLDPHVLWSGTPTPPIGVFPLYGARAFFGGYGFDFGIEADGSPACRVNTPQGWKKFTLP